LRVPHRKSFVIGREELLKIVSPRELGSVAASELPSTVLLLAELEDTPLTALRPADALRTYWRLLFHESVHAAIGRRRQIGKLSESDIRSRVARIGRSDIAAAAAVLRQESLLLPPRDLSSIYEEFAALYLELRHFDPKRLPLYFPLVRFDVIDQVLAEDIDAAAVFARTRLEGAAETEASDYAPELPALQSESAAEAPASSGGFERLCAAAARSRRRGNLVRAAIRSERAARAGDPLQRNRARAETSSDLDRLSVRLQKALDLSHAEATQWRQVLGALVGPAASGLWTAEGRLLYDLQKICIDSEREVYAIDFVEWFVSGFRRPLRRHLPHQRHVVVLKHLRSAVNHLSAVRLSPELRTPFHAHLHAAVAHAEQRIRDRFRPGARAALDAVGLSGHSRAAKVSRDKIVEELLDRVVERDLLTMSDLRDAVARNRVKLPDLSGAGEFFLGDRLIRANRLLARHLDGVYRRGEIYLRWLQRVTSAAFGTIIGRAFTLLIALPFGGAFILLEGFKALLHELPGHESHHTHDTSWLERHLIREIVPTVGLGLFLLCVIHLPRFRQLLVEAFRQFSHYCRVVFIDGPAYVLNLPAVRKLLQSRPFLLLYLIVLKPLAFALLVPLILNLAGYELSTALAAGGVAFLLTSLLLNSPLGFHFEEVLADQVVRGWELVRRDIVPGLYYLVVTIFRMLMERLERLLYAVDEWLRFRTGDSALSAVAKPVLGLAWFVVAYAVRAVINLFVEPTFNPIKHIPVVTVAAKLLVPFIPTLAAAITAAAEPVVGLWLGGLLAATVLFFIPGFAGFLVWELKENWRLYAANQPATLVPEVVGSHGETVRRLLRPGFHSGTVPKLFAKLRHADGKSARKREEALRHVADAVTRFTARNLLAVLEESSRWGDSFRLHTGEIALGTNRIRLELRCRDVVDPPLCIDIDEECGRLLAGISCAGWLKRATKTQRQALADALAGFYHLAGVDLVREEIAPLLPPASSYGVSEKGLAVWPANGADGEVNYTLAPGACASPADGWPNLCTSQLVFSERPMSWTHWVEIWEEDGDQDKAALLSSETILLRCR
jgi:hypothetical protein